MTHEQTLCLKERFIDTNENTSINVCLFTIWHLKYKWCLISSTLHLVEFAEKKESLEGARKLKDEIMSGPSSDWCRKSGKAVWSLEALPIGTASINLYDTNITLCDSLLGEQVICSAPELFWILVLVNIITIFASFIGLWLMGDIFLNLDWVLIYHIRLQLTASLFQFIWSFLQKNSKTYDGFRYHQPKAVRKKNYAKLI